MTGIRDPFLLPRHILPEKAAQEVPGRDPVDALLDKLETAEVTGVRSESHEDDASDQVSQGKPSLVTLEFGDVSIRERVVKQAAWCPDICWKGHMLPKPSKEQAQRARRIFRGRIAQEAAKSLKRPANSQMVDGIVEERDM